MSDEQQRPELAALQVAAQMAVMSQIEADRLGLYQTERPENVAIDRRRTALLAAATVWQGRASILTRDILATAEEFLAWLQQEGTP